MNSEIAESLDKDLSLCHTWGVKQTGETLLSMVDVDRYSGEIYKPRLFALGRLHVQVLGAVRGISYLTITNQSGLFAVSRRDRLCNHQV